MRKNFIFILIILVSMFFISCDKDAPDNKEIEDSTKVEEKVNKEETKEEKEEEQKENTESTAEKEEKDAEESKEEETKEPEKEVEVMEFDSMTLGNNVSKYVSLMPLEDVKKLVHLSDEFTLVKDNKANKYTGIIKERYISDTGAAIRIPYINPISEDMNYVNEEISKIFEEDKPYYHIDYDAVIYNNILSIMIKSDYNHILASFNIDISLEKPKLLTSKEMFERLSVDENVFMSFLELYVRQYLECTYPTEELSFEERDEKIQDIIISIKDAFYMSYHYNNAGLYIYKSLRNEGYELEIPYAFNDHIYLNIGLASTEFDMAVLSRPYNAIGFLYKPNIEVENIPTKDALNGEIIFHSINPEQTGESIYFMVYPNDNQFSDGSTYIELSNVEYNFIEDEFYPKKILKKDFDLERTDKTDLYLYHTVIPEGMPFEVICMDMGTLSSSNQIPLSYDGRYGDPIEYVYGAGFLFDYQLYTEEKSCKISIMPEREFSTSGDWKDLIGINITKGTYTNDQEYYYLYPSKEDVDNGSSEVYIFKILPTGLQLVYGSNEGSINAPEIPIVATGWYDDEY